MEDTAIVPTARRPIGPVVVAALAFAQGLLASVRAFDWVRIGIDLMNEGLVLIPLVGLVAIGRGVLVVMIALLYVLCAVGLLIGAYWAAWFGSIAALINAFLVLSLMHQGEPVLHALLWIVVPVILIVYFLWPKAARTVA